MLSKQSNIWKTQEKYNELTKRLYGLLDEAKGLRVDFIEFVEFFSIFAANYVEDKLQQERIFQICFSMYDNDNDKIISDRDLYTLHDQNGDHFQLPEALRIEAEIIRDEIFTGIVEGGEANTITYQQFKKKFLFNEKPSLWKILNQNISTIQINLVPQPPSKVFKRPEKGRISVVVK